ncbi:MAG: hypothetical protein RMJ56_00795 [Gemmataceae bacterium]|nr:hypothetical protein [Gemmata sp.]MDW8196118.1 hypothetical protein [Gemmataceae bacterium]
MNNTCPSCGVLYNVTEKDIGRRLKCKKCNAPLKVTDKGLETDIPTAPFAPVPPPVRVEPDDDLTLPPPWQQSRQARFRARELFAPIGGLPGLLFATGIVFILFFTFMMRLGTEANLRAAEYRNKLVLEKDIKIRKLLPKGKTDPSQLEGGELTKFNDERKRIEDEYLPLLLQAEDEHRATEISNKRLRLYEGYGQLFGFILLAFGCLGFALNNQVALLLRIVAGIILVGMALGLFKLAVGTETGIGASLMIG